MCPRLALRHLLAKLLSIPVGTWSFQDDHAVRHIGPYSEDFHAAFDLLGHDPQHLAVTDVNGVALAAIQGLARRFAEQQEALEELRRRNRELRGQVAFLVESVSYLP